MAQYPERYGNQIIRLSRYMYLKSGYYKRLVDYFVNMAVVNWTVDFEPKTIKALSPDEKMAKTIQSNYVKYVSQVNKFNLDNAYDVMEKEKKAKQEAFKASKMPGIIEWVKNNTDKTTEEEILKLAEHIFNKRY